MDNNQKSLAKEIADSIEEDIKNSRGLDFAWEKISSQYKRRLRAGWRNRIQRALDEVRNMF